MCRREELTYADAALAAVGAILVGQRADNFICGIRDGKRRSQIGACGWHLDLHHVDDGNNLKNRCGYVASPTEGRPGGKDVVAKKTELAYRKAQKASKIK